MVRAGQGGDPTRTSQPTADDPSLAAIARAIEEFGRDHDPFAVEHEIQVTSYGGTGTTVLVNRLLDAGLSMPPGPGQWPHKHHWQPPAGDAVPPGFRAIYIAGDPRDALLSIFRRGYAVGRYHNLFNTEPGPEITARLETLEGFLAAGIDDFALADHVRSWRDHPRDYPVMFVRYDELGDAWPEIADFAGIPVDPPLDFQPRASDWRSLPEPLRTQLDELYGELAAVIEGWPPVEVT